MGIVDWLGMITGVNDASGHWSSFWGGIGSDLGEFAIFAILWRKINCHAKGCWRVGLHRVGGTPYITCRKHHPVHPGSAPATAEQIASAHQDAMASLSALGEAHSASHGLPLDPSDSHEA